MADLSGHGVGGAAQGEELDHMAREDLKCGSCGRGGGRGVSRASQGEELDDMAREDLMCGRCGRGGGRGVSGVAQGEEIDHMAREDLSNQSVGITRYERGNDHMYTHAVGCREPKSSRAST